MWTQDFGKGINNLIGAKCCVTEFPSFQLLGKIHDLVLHEGELICKEITICHGPISGY